MPVELKDVQEVAEALGKKFDEFKEKNDKRIDGIEAEKSKLSESVDGLNEKLTELDQLKAALEKELKELKRPGGIGASSKDVDAHKTAFGQFLRKGREEGLRELEQKALQTDVDADGGYAVPEEFDRSILQVMHDMSPMRQICNTMTIGTTEYKRLVNLGGAGSGWVGEHDARPETGTPKLAQITATMGEIYANPQATQTSLDDIFFNAEQWIQSEVAREFSEKEALAFLSGDGINKPKGLLSYTFATTGDDVRAFGQLQEFTSGTAGNFDSDDLLDLIYGLKQGYRASARFMMAGLTVAHIRKFKDADGNYLWQPGLQAGEPSRILNYGIVENEDMPAIGAGNKAILFGDFKRAYTIVDRMGVRMLRDPYTNKPNVGFYTTKRVGGMLVDSSAVKALTLSV